MKTIKGILSTVAMTAGIKVDVAGVETGWINPTKEAKEHVKDKLNDMKNKLKGKEVVVTLNDEDKWSGIELLESEDLPEESVNQENSEEQRINKPESTNKPKEVPKQDLEENASKPRKTRNYEGYDGFLDEMVKKGECTDPKYYHNLSKIAGETKKIMTGHKELTYMSWAEAWGKLKETDPDANYEIYENENGMPYFYDLTGGFVKVSVTTKGVTHDVFLPIMDYRNQAIRRVNMSVMDINKTIQRALTKAIAMHGLGLYIYKGEDLPHDDGAAVMDEDLNKEYNTKG